MQLPRAMMMFNILFDLNPERHYEAAVLALQHEKIHTLDLLLKKGVKPNPVNGPVNTLLHGAVDLRNEKLVKLLLAAGADIDVKNEQGMTPFSSACARKYRNIVLVFLDHWCQTIWQYK